MGFYKHLKKADISAANPENVENFFFVTEFEVYKAIMFFPNGSGSGSDKIVLQILKT